jgi:hypothetical protein
MACSSIMILFQRLRIAGAAYEQAVLDGMIAGRDPEMTLLDCPWNYAGDDRDIKARRVAWRVAFRSQREDRKVSLFALQNYRRAA